MSEAIFKGINHEVRKSQKYLNSHCFWEKAPSQSTSFSFYRSSSSLWFLYFLISTSHYINKKNYVFLTEQKDWMGVTQYIRLEMSRGHFRRFCVKWQWGSPIVFSTREYWKQCNSLAFRFLSLFVIIAFAHSCHLVWEGSDIFFCNCSALMLTGKYSYTWMRSITQH